MSLPSTEKSGLHERNKHRGRYDFDALIQGYPELNTFVRENKYGDLSIDFFDPKAVKSLNAAILKLHYKVDWDIPDGFLCPPIPGRADYIHRISDLLQGKNANQVRCLDIGVGANCIYPIIGVQEYGWNFIASDINDVSIDSAKKIIDSNENLKGKIDIRKQNNPKLIFQGILNRGEKVDAVICNPPFHGSAKEAQAGTLRKLKNLKKKKSVKPVLNFGGQNVEIWCDGGEKRFIHAIIRQSQDFAASVGWFTVLVSKQTILKGIYKMLNDVEAKEVKTIEMKHGNKTSRIVAWTFKSK